MSEFILAFQFGNRGSQTETEGGTHTKTPANIHL